MLHRSATDFWQQYRALPHEVRARADKEFSLLKANPQHPSLQFKRVGEPMAGNMVGPRHMELPCPAIKRADGFLWFWIGDHKAYKALIFWRR
jgi:hypothetical protein